MRHLSLTQIQLGARALEGCAQLAFRIIVTIFGSTATLVVVGGIAALVVVFGGIAARVVVFGGIAALAFIFSLAFVRPLFATSRSEKRKLQTLAPSARAHARAPGPCRAHAREPKTDGTPPDQEKKPGSSAEHYRWV